MKGIKRKVFLSNNIRQVRAVQRHLEREKSAESFGVNFVYRNFVKRCIRFRPSSFAMREIEPKAFISNNFLQIWKLVDSAHGKRNSAGSLRKN